METSPNKQDTTKVNVRETPLIPPTTENRVQAPIFQMASSSLDNQSNVTIMSFLRCTHHLRLKPDTTIVPDLIPMRRTLRRVSMQIRVNMDIEMPISAVPHQRLASRWNNRQYVIKISLCDGFGYVVQNGIFLHEAVKKQSPTLPNVVTTLDYSLTEENVKKRASEERMSASIQSDHFGINRTSCEVYGTPRLSEFSKPPHGLLYLQILVSSKDSGALLARHWTPPLWVFARVGGENSSKRSMLSEIAKAAVDSGKIIWREDVPCLQMYRYPQLPKRATVTFYEDCQEQQGESVAAVEESSVKALNSLSHNLIQPTNGKDVAEPQPQIPAQPNHDADASTIVNPLSVIEPPPLTSHGQINHCQMQMQTQMMPPIMIPAEAVPFNAAQCPMSIAPNHWVGDYNYQSYSHPPPPIRAPELPNPKRRPNIRTVTSISAEVDSE